MITKRLVILLFESLYRVTKPSGKILLQIALLIYQLNSSAQKNVIHQQQVWYGYYHSLVFNENWNLKSEIQERHFIHPVAQHQLLFRADVEYKLEGNWNVFAGGAFFLQHPNDPNSGKTLVIPELRPNIGFNSKQKFSFLTISHRYKAEARFFHDVGNKKLAGGYRFSNFRLRYQLGLDFPLLKRDKQEKIIVKLKDEVMFNFGSKIIKNTFDQNRIYLALNYTVSPAVAVEAGYMNWFQQQKSEVDFFNRDIIRFSVYHNLTLKKKKHE